MQTNLTHARARGFTLVEMMVAMTLSLILLGGVLSVLYSSKVTYNENERVARLQESMRAGVEILLHDLRAGGFPGCARPMDPSTDYLSVLANPTALKWDFSVPVQGFNANTKDWTPALPAPLDTAGVLTGNDVIVVRTVRSNAHVYRLSSSMASGTDSVVIKKDKDDKSLRAGTPMLISDCNKSTVFATESVADGGATATLAHGTTVPTGTNPASNTSSDIGVYKAAGNSSATVAPIDTIIYYVAASSAKDANGVSRGPSLWRISSTEPTTGTGPGTPQEVVEGVEALQAMYGVDTNNDLLVDNYVNAAGVTNWSNVIAISIAVVVRSPEEINPVKLPSQPFVLLDKTYDSPSDRRARAVFTTTVTLRNRTT